MSDPDRIAMFEKMADADPDNELAHFSLGKLRFEAGDYPQAETSLRRALELNSQHTQATRYLAETLLALGRRQEAVELLREGVKLAHVRGEFMPRNTMIDLLKAEGEEPPRLVEDEGESEAAEGSFTCSRCLRPADPLEKPPFRTELGRRIQASVCRDCWKEWMAMSIKVINELRLNPATPEGSRVYDQHMCEFLGLPVAPSTSGGEGGGDGEPSGS